MTSYELSTAKHPKALFIFAHGAGADMDSDFMINMTELLVKKGVNVLRFNFHYMDKRKLDGKRRPPDRMPKLLDCFNEIITQHKSSLPTFIGGKSMGSRVAATLLENSDLGIHGGVCFGYPFHPANKPDKLRLEPLQNTQKPILIMQGTRDKLGDDSEISCYELSSLCKVEFLPDGDHDLKPRVKSGYTHMQHIQTASELVSEFIDGNV